MLVGQSIPGNAIAHADDPFDTAARSIGENLGNGGLGVEKQQIKTTVIYAGNKRSRFKIDGATSL